MRRGPPAMGLPRGLAGQVGKSGAMGPRAPRKRPAGVTESAETANPTGHQRGSRDESRRGDGFDIFITRVVETT